MLSSEERQRIHKIIVTKMLSHRTIDVSDVDAVLIQALAGRSRFALTRVAYMALVADSRTIEQIADHVLFFRFARTDAPIYPWDYSVSVTLRLAQFKLAAATGSDNNVSRIVGALLEEIGAIPEGESKRVLESTALLVVLGTMSIANHLDDWVARLRRLQTIVENDEFLQVRVFHLSSASDGLGTPFLASLFSIEVQM